MKIGIFGGSFNPPHKGHHHILENAKEQCGLDKIFVVPAFVSPFKEDFQKTCKFTPEMRLEMCRLTFEDLPYVEISDYEITKQSKSFTVDTVKYFKEMYPGDELFLIMGGDCLTSFDKWHRYMEILGNCNLIVMPRNQNERNSLVQNARKFQQFTGVFVLNGEPMELSSTLIRLSPNYPCFLSQKVVKYIEGNFSDPKYWQEM
jgi:nicotinate-nucleotide adenylyltransferase